MSDEKIKQVKALYDRALEATKEVVERGTACLKALSETSDAALSIAKETSVAAGYLEDLCDLFHRNKFLTHGGHRPYTGVELTLRKDEEEGSGIEEIAEEE